MVKTAKHVGRTTTVPNVSQGILSHTKTTFTHASSATMPTVLNAKTMSDIVKHASTDSPCISQNKFAKYQSLKTVKVL